MFTLTVFLLILLCAPDTIESEDRTGFLVVAFFELAAELGIFAAWLNV